MFRNLKPNQKSKLLFARYLPYQRTIVPVVFTMINEQDIQNRTEGLSITEIRAQSTARISRKPASKANFYPCGTSSCFVGIPHQPPPPGESITKMPTSANYLTQGICRIWDLCVRHKEQIVYKAIVEKKDPVQVANESKHTQHRRQIVT